MKTKNEGAKKNRWARLDRKVVFFVCDAFLKEKNAIWIAKETKARFNEPLHRTQVYHVLAEGRARGYFRLTPPRDELLAERLMDRFVRSRRSDVKSTAASRVPKVIEVVNHGLEISLENVAIAASDAALSVIKDCHKRALKRGVLPGDEHPAVHVGFGAGSTTMLVARHLAQRLRAEESPPGLVLHALSSGFNVAEPATAPVAFFNFFHEIPGISYRGLFASAYALPKDWQKTRNHVGVRESFEERDKLDIVITSLASKEDPHGELNRFMEVNQDLGRKARQVLDVEQHRLGDVIYRPFNEQGPITKAAAIRAVTLFELHELRAFAADPSKAVILVSGPCGDGGCRRSRHDALLPLLTVPSLDVWTHLVTDDITALMCLGDLAPSP
jgi:hypothetical protein